MGMIQLLNFVLGVDVQENVVQVRQGDGGLGAGQAAERRQVLIFVNLSLLRTAPLNKSSHSGDSNEAGDELPIELRHLEDR